MGVEYKHYLIPEDNTYTPGPEALSRLIDALLDGGFAAREGADGFKMSALDATSDDDFAGTIGCFVQTRDQGRSPFPCPCSADDIAALEGQDFKIVWPIAALEGQDFKIVWPVESSNESELAYPLSPFPEWGDPYYDLEIHMATDFVYHQSELIDPFVDAACRCGRKLDYYEDDGMIGPRDVFPDARIRRACPACGRPFRPQEFVGQVRDGRTGVTIDRPGGVVYRFAVVVDCGKGFAREGWPIRASEAFLDATTRALGQTFYQVGDIY